MAHIFKQALEEDDDQEKILTHTNRNYISHMVDKMNHVSKNKMRQETTKALIENPENLDVFGYDSYFDQINKKREEIIEQKKEKGKVRFMDSLKDAAEKRKRERSIIYERIAEKEISREQSQGNNTERYITQSYKEVLEANKQFLIEDNKKEAYNQNNSVNNKSDLNEIYKTFYKDNLFAGGNRLDINQEISKEKIPQNKNLKNETELINNMSNKYISNNIDNTQGNITNKYQKPNDLKKSRSRSRSLEKNSKNPEINNQDVSKQKIEIISDYKSNKNGNNMQEIKDLKQIKEEQEKIKKEKLELARIRFLERQKTIKEELEN